MSSPRSVVITGCGLVTPFASSREESWQAILAGNSSTRSLGDEWIKQFPGSSPRNLFAGAPAPRLPDADSSQDLVTQLAVTAAREAMAHAELSRNDYPPDRSGCVIGTSKGGLRSFAECFTDFRNRHPFSAQSFENSFSHHPGATVANECGLRGPLLCPVAACATGLTSLIRGAELIQQGDCDLVFAGSSDASLLPMIQSSFHRLGVLARHFEDPSRACRPFSADRDGFLIGEGAAVFVLEEKSAAVSRSAPLLAEYMGGILGADPAGLTQLDAEPASLVHMVETLFTRTHTAPVDVQYINLHGTATPQNDVYESRAVERVFGSLAEFVPCSSVKGAIGHLLGAAGSVETACTLLAMRDGTLPPTCHLEEPDPDCRLNYLPKTAVQQPTSLALKLSLGFGGHLAAALFRKP